MIKIKYECDETEQEMEITIDMDTDENGGNDVKIDFEPTVTDDTEDPYGIMNKLFKIVTGG